MKLLDHHPLRLITLLLLIAVTAINSNAQEDYTLEWSNIEPSQIIPYVWDCPFYKTNECQKVRLDSKNNVIVGGTSLENGNHDILIIKYSYNGDLRWKKLISISNTSSDYLTEIAIDDEDNIVLSGYSLLSANNSQSTIIKLNTDGDEIWESTYSNYDYSFPANFSLDTNGDVYVTGFINSDFSERKLFICKFDLDGEFIWDEIYDNTSATYVGTNIRLIGDSIFLLGRANGSSEIRTVNLQYSKEGSLLEEGENAFEEIFSIDHIDSQGNSYVGVWGKFRITKYDPSGVELWTYEIPTNLVNAIADEVKDIISDESGNVYIAGRHYGEGEGTATYTNGDVQVVKISPDGNEIYSYRYENQGANAFDGANKLFLGDLEYLVVGGQSQDSISKDYSYVAIVLNDSGEPIDTLRYDNQGDDVIKSVIMDNHLNFYVTGTSNGFTLTQKYRHPLAITSSKSVLEPKHFEIYPNPFTNEIVIKSNDFQGLTAFKLFNSEGKLISNEFVKVNSSHVLTQEFLPPGIYFYHIQSGVTIETGKLVKH